MTDEFPTKPVIWVGSSKRDFDAFPTEVRAEMGYALYLAQIGDRHRQTKMMTGLPGVLEVVAAHRGDAFRAIYAVRFASAIFILHAFQKKSKSGISTPQFEMDLVRQRLRDAQDIDKERGS